MLTCFLRGVGDGQFLSLNVMGGKCGICGKRMCESYGLAAAATAWKNIRVVGDMRPADPSRWWWWWCGCGRGGGGGCDLFRGLCGESVRCLWWWWWWWLLPGELCPFVSSWPPPDDFPLGLWPPEWWWWWWWWPLPPWLPPPPWWCDDAAGGCGGRGGASVGVAADEVGESTNSGMRSVWASPRICNETDGVSDCWTVPGNDNNYFYFFVACTWVFAETSGTDELTK